ncbi:hypothetical protein BH11PSE8_BH11PSE8_03890 [soil metagenome]
MQRDRAQSQPKQATDSFRKEWGPGVRHEHDGGRRDRERVTAKGQITHSIRQQEAIAQIRELRARY